MLRHDIAIAWRRALRYPLHTAICVVTLALGLACFIAAYLFVSSLRGYEQEFPNAAHAYLLREKVSLGRAFTAPPNTLTSRPIADQLRIEAPELEAVARVRRAFGVPLTVDGQRVTARIAYAEPDLLEIFSFRSVSGDIGSALRQPRSAIVTAKFARTLYGNDVALGKSITVNAPGGAADVTIAAVMEDVSARSQFGTGVFGQPFDMVVSWDVEDAVVKGPQDDVWLTSSVFTYVLPPKGASFGETALRSRLAAVARRAPDYGRATIELDAISVTSLATNALQTLFQGYFGRDLSLDVLDTLLAFAAAVLALACMNFVNLATAHSLGRAREVGTRKAVGASVAQVLRQDIVHTGLLVAVALCLALAAVAPASRLLQGPWQSTVTVPWAEPRLWVALAALLAGVTIAAGLYPALSIARVRPMAALRSGAARGGARVLRALLVGVQFAAASFLFVTVAVSTAQNAHARAAALDRYEDSYLVVSNLSQRPPLPIDPAVLETELERGPGIKAITSTGIPPFQTSGLGEVWSRIPGDDFGPKLARTRVGFDYFDVLEISVVAGRAFDRERVDDGPRDAAALKGPVHVVLDRSAAAGLGWRDPAAAVGQTIYLFGVAGNAFEVIGVVESKPMSFRAEEASGLVYSFNPALAAVIIMRVAKGELQAATTHALAVADALLPNHPRLVTTPFAALFDNAAWVFIVTSRVFIGLAFFALAIAAIGLFGMASYMTARRTREIGIRKTHGASRRQILRLLVWDFSKPVVVANALAWPLSLYAVGRYLTLFADPIAITPLPFVLALAATLALAWLAVAARAVRAAHVRPMEALRHE